MNTNIYIPNCSKQKRGFLINSLQKYICRYQRTDPIHKFKTAWASKSFYISVVVNSCSRICKTAFIKSFKARAITNRFIDCWRANLRKSNQSSGTRQPNQGQYQPNNSQKDTDPSILWLLGITLDAMEGLKELKEPETISHVPNAGNFLWRQENKPHHVTPGYLLAQL